MNLPTDPTPEEILARRIAIHRKRGEHDFAAMLQGSGGADPRQKGDFSTLREPLHKGHHLTARERKRVIAMIAAGVSQRQIADILKLCRWTVWAALRRLKREVRSMLANGATARQIRQRVGDDAWSVWERSQSRNVKRERRQCQNHSH